MVSTAPTAIQKHVVYKFSLAVSYLCTFQKKPLLLSFPSAILAQDKPAEFISDVSGSMTSSGSSEYLVPTALQPNPSLSGGHAKRIAKKQLPRCFFSYDRGTNTVSGAFLATRCFALSSDAPDLWWQVDRVVELESPVKLERDSIQWSSTVLH